MDGWIQSRYACIHASASTACMQTLWVWGVRWLLEAVLAVLVGIRCGWNTQAVEARVDGLGGGVSDEAESVGLENCYYCGRLDSTANRMVGF